MDFKLFFKAEEVNQKAADKSCDLFSFVIGIDGTMQNILTDPFLKSTLYGTRERLSVIPCRVLVTCKGFATVSKSL
jgi:hypothetical protein